MTLTNKTEGSSQEKMVNIVPVFSNLGFDTKILTKIYDTQMFPTHDPSIRGEQNDFQLEGIGGQLQAKKTRGWSLRGIWKLYPKATKASIAQFKSRKWMGFKCHGHRLEQQADKIFRISVGM